MSKPVSIDSVTKFLTALGSTPDEIAKTLKRRGVKGVAFQSDKCPLVNALKRRWPSRQIIASIDVVYIDDDEITLPRSCQRFVSNFDSGLYPDLKS